MNPAEVATCYDLGVNGYIVKGTEYTTCTGAVVDAVRYCTTVNTSVTDAGQLYRPPGA